jgi:hypothetical protein
MLIVLKSGFGQVSQLIFRIRDQNPRQRPDSGHA